MREFETKELERILGNEEEMQPMTGFSTRVMRAVREEATTTEPIPFPWARFLPGFLLNLGLLLGAGVWVASAPNSFSPTQPIPAEWFTDPQAQGLLWAILTVVGTGMLAWATTRWAAPRRTTLF